MSKVIELDMAIAEIEERKYANGWRNTAVVSELNRLEGYIMRLPQSEIIRCKDCKYSAPFNRDKCRCFLWHENGINVFNNGFCNYAEMR